MRTFLVFEPADSGRDAAAAARVVFLREKFHWLALLFAPLWLLWHRLWLGFLLWFAAAFALSLLAYALGLSAQAAAPLLWLPTLLVAFEGSELLRRKLLRRGYREAAIIVAGHLEEAEQRFFAGWHANAATPLRRPVPPVVAAPAAAPASVIGLFPEPGGGR